MEIRNHRELRWKQKSKRKQNQIHMKRNRQNSVFFFHCGENTHIQFHVAGFIFLFKISRSNTIDIWMFMFV